MRGWLGPTGRVFDDRTDKGHLIAHAFGGGLAVNIFPQRRDINRGWSTRGKVYRAMEQYCVTYPGTFCFNRLLYADESSRPSTTEFGILKDASTLWVEQFDNRSR